MTSVAQTRLDSIEITHYDIHLTVDMAAKSVGGHTDLHIQARTNGITTLTLDLLRLQVDSISWNNNITTFSYNDTTLRINAPVVMNTSDSALVKVYYHGTPVSDTRWGGFYFTGVYAFNMGVGFDANPNSFGRVWFPCYDDFKARATFDFYITTSSSLTANCNGLFQSKTNAGNGLSTTHWKETKRTPVYLVAVAIAPYAAIKWNYRSRLTGKNIPVELYSLPADTAKLRASFKNLDSAVAIYEDIFGTYPFDRIGYNIVPFNGGAMEHTGNIAYPLFAIDGTLAYETMMAHELVHSWFGGLYNCATSGDMWLNEGWAVYCEHLFIERMYGKNAFKNAVRENLKEVLHFAHLQEGDYRAVSGVPHAYTYGAHSYKKGAVIAHNYRESILNQGHKKDTNLNRFRSSSALPNYSHWNAQQFADVMMPGNSKNNYWYASRTLPDVVMRFTSDFQPGTGKFKTTFYPGIYHLIAPATNYTFPLCYTWYDSDRRRYDTCVYSHEHVSVFTSKETVFASVNFEELLNFSVTAKNNMLRVQDSVDFAEALMRIKVNTCSDSALVRVEHHWYPADQSYNTLQGLYVSNYRYWNVDGWWPAGFNATAYITYDGRRPVNFGSTGYLDHTFIRKTEDSLVLLYRESPISNWQLYTDAVKTTGGKTDRFGNIRINNLKKGQYALGMYDISLGTSPLAPLKGEHIRVYPNPAHGSIHVEWEQLKATHIRIQDIQGKAVLQHTIDENSRSAQLQLPALAEGIYLLSLSDENNMVYTRKVVLR
jgi:aminopeptidase N